MAATHSEQQVKHLEFIQAVITRMANNSFLIKGWALTIAAAFFAVLTGRLSWKLALVALVPLVMFWLMDAYFLRQERLYRCLYDDVRTQAGSVDLFSMDTRNYRHYAGYYTVATSVTLLYFYGALVVVDLVFLVGAFIRSA